MSSFETVWMPDQKQLYIVKMDRDPRLRDVIVFPYLRRNGHIAQLCYWSSHGHVLSGCVGEINPSMAEFIWEHDGRWDRLTISPLTDEDFHTICDQRRRNRWAVPQSKNELYTWYTDTPYAAN